MSSTTSCKQAGDDRGQVELELGDDQRDGEWMGDVGLARLALLLGMHPRRVLVGAANQLDVGLRVVRLDPPDELLKLGVSRLAGGGDG